AGSEIRGEDHSAMPRASRKNIADYMLLRCLEYGGDVDFDRAAARQTNGPGVFVADTEAQIARTAVTQRSLRFANYGAFDAAARHRADKGTVFANRHLASGRAGRRAPGPGHGGKRKFVFCLHP